MDIFFGIFIDIPSLLLVYKSNSLSIYVKNDSSDLFIISVFIVNVGTVSIIFGM
jgi:hypothetical protein